MKGRLKERKREAVDDKAERGRESSELRQGRGRELQQREGGFKEREIGRKMRERERERERGGSEVAHVAAYDLRLPSFLN